jgi:hypothetical protein
MVVLQTFLKMESAKKLGQLNKFGGVTMLQDNNKIMAIKI